MNRRIVCAAIRDQQGQIVCGPRHFDPTMHATIKNLMNFSTPWEQGFIDQFGTFLTREQAWIVASNEGQIIRQVSSPGTLYSENLY